MQFETVELTVFDWWAQLVIPAIVGLASVTVAVAAWWTSRKSVQMAKDVRDERRRAELLQMSQEEARTLLRWVQDAIKPTWALTRPLDSGRREPTLADEATIALSQSFAPGAVMLLELTREDVSGWNYRVDDDEGFRDGAADDHGNSDSRLRDSVIEWRQQRTVERIRKWGIDPKAAHSEIEADYRLMHDDIAAYWDFRQGVPELQDMDPYQPDEDE